MLLHVRSNFLLLFLSLVLRHDLPLERSHIDVQYDFSPAPVPSSLYSLVKLYHLHHHTKYTSVDKQHQHWSAHYIFLLFSRLFFFQYDSVLFPDASDLFPSDDWI